MSTDSWFRNAEWSAATASLFEERLRRARRKEQYLRIQAGTLARSNPAVAHALLDRYFEMSDDFDHAQAYVDRANAYLSEEKIEDAIASYEQALQREAAFPKLLTEAYLDLPYLIAVRGIAGHFERALQLLDLHRNRLMFPVDYFKWNAALALIADSLGDAAPARTHAEAALAYAEKAHSGFRNHPGVGLVSSAFAEVESSLRRLRDA
jgi:tetratricopeptide (TPR) repeat protein